MIPFHPLDLQDRETVLKYTLKSVRRNCDLSFSNLYSWRSRYRTEIAELGGHLLFRFWAGERLAYMMPVGAGEVKPVIDAMLDDAQAMGQPLLLLGVCSYMRVKLETSFPEKFDFIQERDYFDYIYLRADLAGLKGKRFQQKRNHVNKFRASYPDYEYHPLTPDMVTECLRLENLWCRTGDRAEDEALQAERCSMTAALNHIDELGLLGGTLWVGGRLVAFTYGSPINADTFDTCVEKADTSFDGAYAMINWEFANRIPEQYIYVNREEDLGLEGLRKAKLSYHPEMLLEKYAVVLRG